MLLKRIVHVAVGIVVATLNCSGTGNTSISVHVLDASSGKALSHVWVTLSVSRDNENAHRWSELIHKTDSEGFVEFVLREPIPDRFAVLLGSDLDSCFKIAFSTEQVTKTGIIVNNACDPPRFKYSESPKPGELVVFARHVNFWQRMLREL